jgi:hypothetical protein
MGRCAGATAEKAVPFPDAVRRSEIVLGSLRSTHFARGSARREMREGKINAWFASDMGRAKWVEHSERNPGDE